MMLSTLAGEYDVYSMYADAYMRIHTFMRIHTYVYPFSTLVCASALA